MNLKKTYPINVAIIAVKYNAYPTDIPIPAETQMVAAIVKPTGDPRCEIITAELIIPITTIIDAKKIIDNPIA